MLRWGLLGAIVFSPALYKRHCADVAKISRSRYMKGKEIGDEQTS